MARAAARAGRDPADVRLVAVSKTFDADCVRAVALAGQVDFGENKVQEAAIKRQHTADLPLRWHLVGHLQSNKARKAAGEFAVVHSIDDADLLAKLDTAARGLGRRLEAYVQVDLAREATKHGAPEDHVQRIFEAAVTCGAVAVRGLMVLPPFSGDAEDSRPWFRRLRGLRDRLAGAGVDPDLLAELSMGMSHDFEAAIEEGATVVRVGTAIFGARPARAPGPVG
jgi:PLP dependent protein